MAFNPPGGGGGSSSIAGSTDVTLDSPQDDQVLAYDSDSAKWQNQDGFEPVVSGAKQSVVFQSTSVDDARPTALSSVSVMWLTSYPQQPDNFQPGDIQFEIGDEEP